MKKIKELTRIEKISICQKLGWSSKETQFAIEEFSEIESIISHHEILRICLQSKSPRDRKSIIQQLVNQLEGNVINNIIALKNSHQFLSILRVFNIIDIENSGLFELEHRLTSDTSEMDVVSGSFLRFPIMVIIRPKKKDIKALVKYGLLNDIAVITEEQLLNELIDGYIQNKATRYMINSDLIPHIDSTIDNSYENYFKFMEEIILKLIPILGFDIFNISCLHDYINIISGSYDAHNNEVLKIIKKKLIEKEIDRSEITDKKYWFYYCLIEKIKQLGYKTKTASEFAEKLLRITSRGTLRARYYEKNKVVKRNKSFNLDKYIIEQGFLKEINKYLEKVKAVN